MIFALFNLLGVILDHLLLNWRVLPRLILLWLNGLLVKFFLFELFFGKETSFGQSDHPLLLLSHFLRVLRSLVLRAVAQTTTPAAPVPVVSMAATMVSVASALSIPPSFIGGGSTARI